MTESHLDSIILWMVSGMTDQALATACIAKLGLSPEDVKAATDEARKRITLAADYRRDVMIGTALTRLNDLYGRCLRSASVVMSPDGKTVIQAGDASMLAQALHVQKEINRLAGLAVKVPMPDEPTVDDDSELAAVAGHLLPLGLAGAEYPLREHARLAAQRVREQGGGHVAEKKGDGA